jgi:hypothetical protein
LFLCCCCLFLLWIMRSSWTHVSIPTTSPFLSFLFFFFFIVCCGYAVRPLRLPASTLPYV